MFVFKKINSRYKLNTCTVRKTVMSSVCVLRPVFAFCVLQYVRHQNARRSPKCLEMLGVNVRHNVRRSAGKRYR